jgi:outer membrane biosynthesis protein TonB
MRFIDRFTLDDVSAKVWWPFTMLLLVLLVLTLPAENRAIDARRRATSEADAALGARVIAPNLAGAPSGTIDGAQGDQLKEEVRDEILVNDGRIVAVRLWSPTSHELVWSSLGTDRPGTSTALNDDAIDAAVAAGAPTGVTTDRGPDNAPSPTLYYAYSTQGPQPVVAEFEYLDSELTSDVRTSWLGYQIVLGLGLLLTLALSLLSMREPKARIGTGVPFYPESLPSDLSVVDSDRAVVIEHAAARIRERVGALQNALDESEASRRRVEGQLQQALAALNTPGHRMPIPTPEPIRGVAPRPAAREPEPAPTPEPIVPEPIPEPEPIVPTPVPQPEPIVPKPVPEPEPIVPTPEPLPEPEPQVEQEPEPEPAAAASTDGAVEPEVVVVPELQPAGEESASDLLDRLVEPVGAHDPSDDAGDLRARLARTAAIKKPGSKERREADEKQYRH